MLVQATDEGANNAMTVVTKCPWKPADLREGLVKLDSAQLAKLIRQDDVAKYYELETEPIARGPFSVVRRCRHRSGGRHAVAKIAARWRCGDDCLIEVQHEVALLAAARGSPRIVRLLEAFQEQDQVITILELATGGDLQTVLDDDLVPLEEDVIKYVRQLLEGVSYLHERGIAHLDIKPQNLVLTAPFPTGDAKLCDFEVSRVIAPGAPPVRELLGTPDYVAPEILQYDPITTAADLWSVGVTTYVLLTGFTPFGGENDQETFCNVSRAQLDFPEELFDDVSADAKDFIARLLIRDPSQRPSAKECLNHRWIRRRGSNSSESGINATKSSSSIERPSLRKYLSKSREALYEKVIQRYGSRLCTSQLSLACRRPRCGGSAEKLYGLRTLSRSHEGLLAAAAAAAAAVAAAAAAVGTEETIKSQALQSPALILEQWANYRNGTMENNNNNTTNNNITSPSSTNEEERNNSNQNTSMGIEQSTDSIPSPTLPIINPPPTKTPLEDDSSTEQQEEEEEPRFTVAQLISAFNRHQEAANQGCVSYPTGPTALRLFMDMDNRN